MKKCILLIFVGFFMFSCSLDEFKSKDISIEMVNMTSKDIDYSIEIFKLEPSPQSPERLSIFGPEHVQSESGKTLLLPGEKTNKGSSEGFYRLNIIENDQAVMSKDFGYFDGILSGATTYILSVSKDSIGVNYTY